MSDILLDDLPELRPVRLQGKAYYRELKRILKEVGDDIEQDARQILRDTGKFTVRDLAFLALKYRLNMKATCEHLEECRVLKYGTYDSLKERKLRPMAYLKEVWSECRAGLR
jgi:hypothetical protein